MSARLRRLCGFVLASAVTASASAALLACPPSVGELCDYGACDAAPDARRSDAGDASREAAALDGSGD